MLWSYVSDYWHRHIEKVANGSLPVTLESRVVQLLDRRSRGILNLSRIASTYAALETDLHLKPEDVCPPLFYCASLVSLWPIRFLIENGANIDEVSGNDWSNDRFALQHAITAGKTENVKFLLHGDANANTQGGHFGNALQAAANYDHVENVQLLLDNGADINEQVETFGNALQEAATKGNAEIVQLLLDKGADVNAQGGYFGNALQAALASEMYNVAKLLHSRGAKVYPPGPMWEEILTRVSQYPGKEKVNHLKEFQADPTAFLAKDGLFKD
jgi:ankyrin repeat protein